MYLSFIQANVPELAEYLPFEYRDPVSPSSRAACPQLEAALENLFISTDTKQGDRWLDDAALLCVSRGVPEALISRAVQCCVDALCAAEKTAAMEETRRAAAQRLQSELASRMRAIRGRTERIRGGWLGKQEFRVQLRETTRDENEECVPCRGQWHSVKLLPACGAAPFGPFHAGQIVSVAYESGDVGTVVASFRLLVDAFPPATPDAKPCLEVCLPQGRKEKVEMTAADEVLEALLCSSPASIAHAMEHMKPGARVHVCAPIGASPSFAAVTRGRHKLASENNRNATAAAQMTELGLDSFTFREGSVKQVRTPRNFQNQAFVRPSHVVYTKNRKEGRVPWSTGRGDRDSNVKENEQPALHERNSVSACSVTHKRGAQSGGAGDVGGEEASEISRPMRRISKEIDLVALAALYIGEDGAAEDAHLHKRSKKGKEEQALLH